MEFSHLAQVRFGFGPAPGKAPRSMSYEFIPTAVFTHPNIGTVGYTEAQARERFRAQDYVLVKHKISSGHCHEFYAVDAQGTVVESYLHPITGEVVRTTRVPAPPPPPNKP